MLINFAPGGRKLIRVGQSNKNYEKSETCEI